MTAPRLTGRHVEALLLLQLDPADAQRLVNNPAYLAAWSQADFPRKGRS